MGEEMTVGYIKMLPIFTDKQEEGLEKQNFTVLKIYIWLITKRNKDYRPAVRQTFYD